MPSIIDIQAIPEDNEITVDENFMRDICDHVANGGTPTRYCELAGINYAAFMRAIEEHEFEQDLVRAKIRREEWLKEKLLNLMNQITDISIKDLFDENGHYKSIQNVPDRVASMIKKARIRLVPKGKDEPPDEILEVEFYDKQKSIDQLGKHLQMFVERIVINHAVSLEDTIDKSWKLKPSEDK